EKDLAQGVRLACMTYPESDLVVEIPLGSQMRRGAKIAAGSKLGELQKSVQKTCEGEFRPVTRKIFLKLPPPDLDDNISDVERLKRELIKRGFEMSDIHINLPIIRKLGAAMREKKWTITVTFLMAGNVVEVMDVQPGDTTKPRYGAAVDVGTTSLVVYLVDMSTGKIIDVASTYNPQVRCGEDIISRIVYASEMNGLDELQRLVINSVNGLIARMADKNKVHPEKIDTIVISGNTTMTHLFYGINPAYIREEPYIPTATFLPLMRTRALGLNLNDFGVIYAMPGVASYVGGDITSGILASRLYKKPELSLFIDIGTNGEIVLGNSDWMVTAACSAGPAFEGGGVKSGMRAMDGAIEKVAIDPDTLDAKFSVIGDVPPIGICGSGMIDAVAEMFLTGVIDQRGKLDVSSGNPRVREGEGGPEYVLAWADESGAGKDIALTEPDIDNIIRTKGAIYAGFSTLLAEVGFGFPDVEKVYIAGGFGNYLDVERAITIGLLPDLPVGKFEFLGNTSIMGAYMALLSKSLRKDAEEIARKLTYLELSVSRRFMDEYVSALFLPHTHSDEFPTVERMRKVGAEGRG
ncbi:MAG TPA: ASKHA domain-containing protein, partial [Nitrospirota bacterium]|nr:ASKHA domain-containing protein [Nitrospirota bacterium]